MKVNLKNIVIDQFMGFPLTKIDFSNHHVISGYNATRKTSTLNAVIWGLYGKNITDDKKFDWYPLLPDNSKKEEYCVIVKLSLTIDERSYTILRKKERIKDNNLQTGFREINTFEINNREYGTENAFNSIITEMFNGHDEKTMMMFILPTYIFDSLDPKVARNKLAKVAGEITDMDVMLQLQKSYPNKEVFEKFSKKLMKWNFETIEQRVLDEKKEIKSKLDQLIDKMIKEKAWLDKNSVDRESNFDLLIAKRSKLQEKIDSNSENIKHNSIVETMKAELKITQLKLDNRTKINSNDIGIREVEILIKENEKNKENHQEYIILRKDNLQKISSICDSCGQELTATKMSASKKNIEDDIAHFKEKEKSTIKYHQKLNNQLTELKNSDIEVDSNLDELNKLLDAKLKLEISEKKYGGLKEVIDLSDATDEITKITYSVGVLELIKKLTYDLGETKKEIEVVKEESAMINQKLDLVKFYVNQKIAMLEASVSKLFKNTKIKLFNMQANGVLAPIFTMYCKKSGAVLKGTNSAMILTAKLEMNNAIQEIHGVNVFILLDKSETFDRFPKELIRTQIIRTFVEQREELNND